MTTYSHRPVQDAERVAPDLLALAKELEGRMPNGARKLIEASHLLTQLAEVHVVLVARMERLEKENAH